MADPTMKQVEAGEEIKVLEVPEREQIAALAYALWEARGCPEGSSEVDWFQAEQEVTASR